MLFNFINFFSFSIFLFFPFFEFVVEKYAFSSYFFSVFFKWKRFCHIQTAIAVHALYINFFSHEIAVFKNIDFKRISTTCFNIISCPAVAIFAFKNIMKFVIGQYFSIRTSAMFAFHNSVGRLQLAVTAVCLKTEINF